MSAPVILTTASILQYLQWQSWEYQPYASNFPSGWLATPLPPGMTFDTLTGLISGASTKPGVFNTSIIAFNADGASAPVDLAIGIEASTGTPPIDVIELSVDLGTMEVASLSPSLRKASRILVSANGAKSVEVVQPLFWLKRDDIKLFHVRFQKGGVTSAIILSALELATKAREPEDVLVSSTTFLQADTGENTFYRMSAAITGNGLDGELSDSEDDDGTEIAVLFELRWEWANSLTPTVGPETLRSSSMNFWVGIARDLNTPE